MESGEFCLEKTKNLAMSHSMSGERREERGEGEELRQNVAFGKSDVNT